VNLLREAYPDVVVIDATLANEPGFSGAIKCAEPWAVLHEMLKGAQGFIGVDSCLQHFSASVGKRGVVLWGSTRANQYGYAHNANLTWNDPLFSLEDPRNIMVDPQRVVVMGGSYGGYMTLASLVNYGDRLRGGINVVGISQFVTFLTNTSGYRRDLRRAEYGDERDPRMRAYLNRISPLTNAGMIRKPLLVVQGLNDPRVPASESEQLVAKLRANRSEVWYLAAKDEGHGFRKKGNRDFYLKTAATFLERLRD
jgi:fermentation-respiration switch protein FrsA (DUF1100 family)